MKTSLRFLAALFLLSTSFCVAAADLAAALESRMQAAVAEGFSGTLLVADGERVIFEKGYGIADPAEQTPVTPATRFNLASAGKLFTAVAVMQLVQQGRLDLDAPLGTYMPDWPVAKVRERVTARQLLMHTSGLQSYWGAEFDAMRGRLRNLSDYRPLVATAPATEPGSAWQYSNSGFVLLGLLVEAVSGEDYYDYIGRHVFAPAGMGGAGYFDIDGKADGVAVPMRGGTGADRFAALPMPEPRGGGAGGGYASARDLLAFHRALLDGRLLDSATLDQLLAPVRLPPGTRAPPHGLGVLRFAVGDDVGYGHPGGAPGVGVDFRGTRQGGAALVLMSNSDSPRTMPLAFDLYRLLAEHGGPDLRFAMPPRQ